MEYPYIKRTLLALGILMVSLAITLAQGLNFISVIGGILGFLVFSYNFKKVVIPIIFLIIFILPMTLYPASFFNKFSIPFTRFYVPFVSPERLNFSKVEEPVSSIPSAKDITIDGPGFIIEFDKNGEDIKVPKGVVVKRSEDRLIIEAPAFEHFGRGFSFGLGKSLRTKKIIIGAKSRIDRLSIETMGVRITGYINPVYLSVDGMGVDIRGTLNLETLKIDGMGVRIRADVERAVSIEIDGMGADLDLNYKVPWEGVWHLSVDGMGARINYRLPPNNPGELKIEKNGLGNMVNHYGD